MKRCSSFLKVLLIAVFSAAYYDGLAQGLIETDPGPGSPDPVSVKAKSGRNLQVGITQGFIFLNALLVHLHFI